MSTELVRRSIVPAAATTLAAIASCATVYGLCRWAGANGSGPAVAAAVFAVGYGRRPAARGIRQLLFAPPIVACVALAALGVGRLLLMLPFFGAAIFVLGMAASVYARNYDGWIRRTGALIALPLVTMLVVPVAPAHAPGGVFVDIALGASAGIVSLLFATLAHALVRGFGLGVALREAETATRAARAGMPPATRMALQMGVALGAAFALGFSVFPAHWGWTVLTAFIVCSGARGRGDAVHKGALRLVGALGGTVVAALSALLWAPSGSAEAALIFALLFVALVLRETNYAYWAAGTTLILALLARGAGGFDAALLGTRLESILAGAVCAVLAAWFVFPIRTEDVVRRRLADALKALDDAVSDAHDPALRPQRVAHVDRRMNELEGVAAPVRWHRRLFARGDAPAHPARWIDLALDVRRQTQPVLTGDVTDEKLRGRLRRAIGLSRRAIGQHRDLAAEHRVPIERALEDLRDLTTGVGSATVRT